VEAYKAAYPNQPYPPANEQLGQGYVVGQIIRQALEKTASRDPQKIRDTLASTEFINLPYPATKVKFGENGLNIYNQEVLGEWMKGELRTVWPKDMQAVPPLL
jgi:branched-chain amino acid transport system substrate-binding protein